MTYYDMAKAEEERLMQRTEEEYIEQMYKDEIEKISGQPDPATEVINSIGEPTKGEYDFVNPNHYKDFFGIEAVEIFEKSFKTDEYIGWLRGSYLKYAMRLFAGKPGEDEKRTIEKMRWFWNKYQDFVKENNNR